MKTLNTLRDGFSRLLEIIVVINMLMLAGIVIVGFLSRLVGSPFAWYDEAASISLAWLTYYGAALAAAKGAHIACPSIVNAFPPQVRLPIAMLGEALTIAFFVLLAITGWQVVDILAGSTMISLTSVSLQFTQSALPIASVLFIIAELLRLPEIIRQARGEGFVDHELEEIGLSPNMASQNDTGTNVRPNAGSTGR
ncbi:TRAP transporter small permease [Salinicola halimionae]|uniref:TRAP transporter small permease n=1 Tax=Salinicola halimionae TaxID=1949081 RepID=UPI001FD8D59F|nr:TRAP transporter small permease [Salinicola halimionae]